MTGRLHALLTMAALLALAAHARAQIVAETIGYTIRDRQMYGPAIRLLAFDSLSGTHAVWKDGYGDIRYNYRPRPGGWRWPRGMVVNADPRTLGSMDIDVSHGTAMFAATHLYRNEHLVTRLADTDPGAGAFYEEEITSGYRYPLIGAANYGYYKFAALRSETLFYRAYLAGHAMGHVGAFPAFNLAVSKQSGRYGFIWAETEGSDRGTLFLKETPNNGQNWFETSRLSDSIPSPFDRSMLSGCGTYDSTRIHLIADFYDGTDVLHSQIWHYAKYPVPTWHLVHEYTCAPGARIGDDALVADRPSIGMNRALGEVYAVWEQFDPGNVDPVTGLCRADIWAARTVDADYNWGPALRLTWPDSTNKRFPFLSEVVDDTLHVIYFADSVAGFSEQGQGPQTTSAVVYLRIPVGLLPTGIAEHGTPCLPAMFLDVSPNPFTRMFTVRLVASPPASRPPALRVFDARGRCVRAEVANRQSGISVALPSSPPGVYFIVAATGHAPATCRVTKAP